MWKPMNFFLNLKKNFQKTYGKPCKISLHVKTNIGKLIENFEN